MEVPLKLAARQLPPEVDEAAFEAALVPVEGLVGWRGFAPGLVSEREESVPSRSAVGYVRVHRAAYAPAVAEAIRAALGAGVEVLEAPQQRVPKSRYQNDRLAGSILRDPEYAAFCEAGDGFPPPATAGAGAPGTEEAESKPAILTYFSAVLKRAREKREKRNWASRAKGAAKGAGRPKAGKGKGAEKGAGKGKGKGTGKGKGKDRGKGGGSDGAPKDPRAKPKKKPKAKKKNKKEGGGGGGGGGPSGGGGNGGGGGGGRKTILTR